VGAGQSKAGEAVVERRGVPTHCRVAVRAIGRGKSRSGRGMHGIICLLPGREVTTRIPAIGRRNGQIVVVVDMAGRAGHVGVAVRQQEAGRTVVESGGIPACGVVATGAVGGCEGRPGRGVDRIVGLLPGCEVAGRIAAIGGRDRQIIVVIYMATCARDVGMAGRQRETRGAVIKRDDAPGNSAAMAAVAIRRSERRTSLGMRRIVGLLPGGQVAARVPAISRGNLQMKVVIDVALCAGHVRVASGERKINRWTGVVSVEGCPQPGVKRRMAAPAACRGKVSGVSRVRGVGGALPILQMARIALRG